VDLNRSQARSYFAPLSRSAITRVLVILKCVWFPGQSIDQVALAL
jgi:hypothetical protein